jgi:hypothetical protein
MTTNDQMKIRIHQAPPNTDVYGLGAMPLINPAEAVEVELPDGTMLYGVVVSEWDEITNDSRVLTKTIRVHSIEGGA